jgi:hypothetical protein
MDNLNKVTEPAEIDSEDEESNNSSSSSGESNDDSPQAKYLRNYVDTLMDRINDMYGKHSFVYGPCENPDPTSMVKTLMQITMRNNFQVVILPDDGWDEIKQKIDTKLANMLIPKICNMCKKGVEQIVTCSKCPDRWCVVCYCNLFIRGQGIIQCPKCKHTIGHHVPKHMMRRSVTIIKMAAAGMDEYDEF